MDKAYWLGRKKASLKPAGRAASSEGRRIHYELAGRYNLDAFSDASAIGLGAFLPRPISSAPSHTTKRA